jgi:hypothetical protein
MLNSFSWLCRLGWVVVLFGSLTTVRAQSAAVQPVDLQLESAPLAVIIDSLTTKYSIQFFYQENQLPTRTMRAQYRQEPLGSVLDDVLAGTGLSVLYYRDYAVIIAPSEQLSKAFTADYFESLERVLGDVDSGVDVIRIGSLEELGPSGRAEIRGSVIDRNTGEPVIGATVFVTDLGTGTSTDEVGAFTLSLPPGEHEIRIQSVGYNEMKRTVFSLSDGELQLELRSSATELEEVVVTEQARDVNVSSVQIGVDRLAVESIRKTPALLGEADVVRTLLLRPGVTTVGEGATGFNVRGGEVDQNLILQDENFLLNASHALGFFSTFNADLVRSVELYKGNIPAQYGGRLASVLDVQMRDGDFERFRMKGGIGPVAGRFSVEGPLVKDRTSFIAGVRSSYSDYVLGLFNIQELDRSSAFFYDANLRLTHRLGDNSSLVLAGYASDDDFTFDGQFGFNYRTRSGQAILRNFFSDDFFSKLAFSLGNYDSEELDLNGADGARLRTQVNYYRLKEVLNRKLSESLTIEAGFTGVLYQVQPGQQEPFGPLSLITPAELEEEKGLELAAFAEAQIEVSPALQISAGLRFVNYRFLGPKTVFDYLDPENPRKEEITGSNLLEGTIATYNSLEPRFSARYRLSASSSIKAGYSRTAQFINQLFNSASPAPTSQFQLSTEYIPPHRAHNFSIGYFRNFKDDLYEFSIEGYGRIVDQLLDYRDFADLRVNPNLETELLVGDGIGYGAEVSLHKKRGLLNGRISYTYAFAERRAGNINGGEYFPGNSNKPHDVSVLLNYNYNQRNTVTVNFTYSTGRPITAPVGSYRSREGLIVPIYSDRNQLRIPDYHRLDLAYTVGTGYRKDRPVKISWTFSLYNVYARRNAFSIFFTQDPSQTPQANRLAVIGTIFPALTINFETI